jgi:hypothetical protein
MSDELTWRRDQRQPPAARLTQSEQIVCRRCFHEVSVSVVFLCGRRRGVNETRRFAECACRDIDVNGLLIIPGPAITADDLQSLRAEIRLYSAADSTADADTVTCSCGKAAVALCDHIVAPSGGDPVVRSRTCDSGMCASHRTKISRDRDVCSAHVPAEKQPRRIRAIELALPFGNSVERP